MRKTNKKHRLLLQVTAIVLPLFAVMTAAIVWLIYTSTVNGFLEAQKDHMKDLINNTLIYSPFMSSEAIDDDSYEWMIQQLEKDPPDPDATLPQQQKDKLEQFIYKHGSFSYDVFVSMPDDVRKTYMHAVIVGNESLIQNNLANSNFDDMFFVDLSDEYFGQVLYDFNKDGTGKKPGEKFELDLSDHPALKEIVDNTTEEIVFERTEDFPSSGNYYIAYKPVLFGGKVRAAYGIACNWDELHSSVMGTITKAIIICICGIAAALVALLIFLHRRAIRPISEIEHALVEYTKDKSSAKIAAKMLKVYTNNEIGYLSDVISDLALEIDHYTKEVARSEKELYEAKVQIMVSQIRPHFMYNTLSSIAILCRLNPETAYEAAVTFSDYLRGNMDSLKQTTPVPFTRELEHLKKYLYIEKLRFEDLLNVEYDIQTTAFDVPMLSIQPIVENAVKHGVGMKDDGGTVKISTIETDDAFEIIITDDGVGFDVNAPKKDDGRTHVGMENTKKRLKDMCGADIIITSEIGKGTTARVIIPKKKEDNAK